MSQDQYWSTILTDQTHAVAPASHEWQPPPPQMHMQPNTIPRPEGAYLQLGRVRTSLEIPARELGMEYILIHYPDWPTDAAPEVAWKAILKAVEGSFSEYQEGVNNINGGEPLKWSLSPGSDRACFQTPTLRKAITDSVLSKLRNGGYDYCANRLSRCQYNWAIEDLLDKRVKLHRREQRKTSVAAPGLEG
ncbi:hypothetical protein TWF281_010898 [Arthrobotrys megalospora]